MNIDEVLNKCSNVFDVAAVMYRECEGYREKERRFHRIQLDLQSSKLESKFSAVTNRIGNDLDPLIDGILLSNTALDCAQILINYYSEFRNWLHNSGYNQDIAAWATLQSLDNCLDGRILNIYRSLLQDTAIRPLNNNFVDGLPRVFLKMPSRVQNRLTALKQQELSVTAYLSYLALIDDINFDVDMRIDRSLWFELSSAQFAIAIISPDVNISDFAVRDASDHADVSRAFWVDAQESKEYRERVITSLRLADSERATMAVLPELSASELLESEISAAASKERFHDLRLVVLGSRHIDWNERKANRCKILDRSGQEIWAQYKREPYSIPEDAGQLAACREWIYTEHQQILMHSPIGSIAVQICLDYLQNNMPDLLCKLGCRWFLVPSMTGGLKGQFSDASRRYGRLAGAVSAISNNRYLATAEGQTNISDEDLYLFYEPVKSNSRANGDKIGQGIWILRFPKEVKDLA